jgi:hypothetical protein
MSRRSKIDCYILAIGNFHVSKGIEYKKHLIPLAFNREVCSQGSSNPREEKPILQQGGRRHRATSFFRTARRSMYFRNLKYSHTNESRLYYIFRQVPRSRFMDVQ